jgi:hypothetical protein
MASLSLIVVAVSRPEKIFAIKNPILQEFRAQIREVQRIVRIVTTVSLREISFRFVTDSLRDRNEFCTSSLIRLLLEGRRIRLLDEQHCGVLCVVTLMETELCLAKALYLTRGLQRADDNPEYI